jgi:DNA-binding NtrC family response regulator
MATPRLLIVDDDPVTVHLLCEVATRYFGDMQVDGTDCPLTALEYAKTTEYSVVLTDFIMPGIDGLQLAAGIHATHPNIPIVIMSGAVGALEHCRPGVFALLRKPLDIALVLETLQSALAGSSSRDPMTLQREN